MPRILAALDDLLTVRGETDLREVGRSAVLELVDRLDARQWIDWDAKQKGPVDALVMVLWRRCRPQAIYRRALPEALTWREGLGDVGSPVAPEVSQDPFERAKRVGYAVIGTAHAPGEVAYRRWCDERTLPLVVVYTGGEYPRDPGTVTGAEHARVSLELPHHGDSSSAEDRAELEASCRVCIPPDDTLGRVSCSSDSVTAIVPIGLAAPLAARLAAIVGRQRVGQVPAEPRPDLASRATVPEGA